MEQILELLQNILFIIISGCGIAIAKYIVSFVSAKIDEAQASTKLKEYEQLNKYIDAAQAVISNIVLSVSQTYVDTYKLNNEWTPEMQHIAKQKAMDMAKDMISEESKNAIIMLYNDFDKYVDNVIESCVKQNKAK